MRIAIQNFMAHYHLERNHQGVGNRLIQLEPDQLANTGAVQRRKCLGGMLNYYFELRPEFRDAQLHVNNTRCSPPCDTAIKLELVRLDYPHVLAAIHVLTSTGAATDSVHLHLINPGNAGYPDHTRPAANIVRKIGSILEQRYHKELSFQYH